MNKIVVQKECGCFKKSKFENNISFKSKDEAVKRANEMVDHMNNKFCKKHKFELKEDNGDFLISVEMR